MASSPSWKEAIVIAEPPRQRPRRRKLLARLRPFGLLAAGLQWAARPARSSDALAALGELVNGRAAASSSLVYGPSASSLRACNGRRGLLAHGAQPGPEKKARLGSRRTTGGGGVSGARPDSLPSREASPPLAPTPMC